MVSITTPTRTTVLPPSQILTWISNGTWTTLGITDGWTSTGTINNGTIEIKLYIYVSTEDTHFFQVDSFRTFNWLISYQRDFEHFKFYKDSTTAELFSKDFGFLIIGHHGIEIEDLDTLYVERGLDVLDLSLYMVNSRAFTNIFFAFDNTTYATPSEAWSAGALEVSFDAGYDEVASGNNAFLTILQLVTWSVPGVPAWVFALVDLAIAAPVAYVVAIWILRLIGSVLGGGASG